MKWNPSLTPYFELWQNLLAVFIDPLSGKTGTCFFVIAQIKTELGGISFRYGRTKMAPIFEKCSLYKRVGRNDKVATWLTYWFYSISISRSWLIMSRNFSNRQEWHQNFKVNRKKFSASISLKIGIDIAYTSS